jgi:hypothetical protein
MDLGHRSPCMIPECDYKTYEWTSRLSAMVVPLGFKNEKKVKIKNRKLFLKAHSNAVKPWWPCKDV